YYSFGGNIKGGYEALSIYDYFKAKKRFYKSLKADESFASFGLATIYYRKDNPFHSLDSAYVYINRAHDSYSIIKEKKKVKFQHLVNPEKIDSLRQTISTAFFNLALTENSIEGYQQFINKHSWAKEVERATFMRDSIAFNNAKDANSSIAYQAFISNYATSI